MLIYLHGFNSSPSSHKARRLGQYMHSLGLDADYVCPALTHWPDLAVAGIEKIMATHQAADICLVGSSLGGFYATHLAEKYGLRAVLINPAINPHLDLRPYLGPQQNLYTGERYELTEKHFEQWTAQRPAQITPDRYLLLVETGDEVLDYRLAQRRYAGARQRVVEGGDHSFQSFAEYLAEILQFRAGSA